MDPQLLQSDQFNSSLADYFYLIDRGYPEKEPLKLVCDRYHLPTELRTLLYRGVSSDIKSHHRLQRIIQLPISPLIVDGYNVLLTLMNYRLGHFVFISTDTICRDTGSLFGKIGNESLFRDCIVNLVTFIMQFKELQTIIYLDEPVSNSANHKEMLQSKFDDLRVITEVRVVHSADRAILLHEQGTVASSDSDLIDHSNLPVLDIPHQILLQQYQANLFNLKNNLDTLSR